MIEVGRIGECRDLITRNLILRHSSEKVGGRRRRQTEVGGRGQHGQPHLRPHTHGVVVVVHHVLALEVGARQHHVLALHQVLQHEGGLRLGEVLVGELRVELVGDAIGVTPPVRDQMPLVDEVLGTQVAVVGPVHGHALLMTALVEHEVALETERLAAVRADIGAVPRV